MVLHVFWGIWSDLNKFQLHLTQDIDLKSNNIVSDCK